MNKKEILLKDKKEQANRTPRQRKLLAHLTPKQRIHFHNSINHLIGQSVKELLVQKIMTAHYGQRLADDTLVNPKDFKSACHFRHQQTHDFQESHDWKHDKYYQSQIKRPWNDIVRHDLTKR